VLGSMMPEGTAHRRADRCFATLRSDQRAKDQERNYRNDVALTGARWWRAGFRADLRTGDEPIAGPMGETSPQGAGRHAVAVPSTARDGPYAHKHGREDAENAAKRSFEERPRRPPGRAQAGMPQRPDAVCTPRHPPQALAGLMTNLGSITRRPTRPNSIRCAVRFGISGPRLS
jgi:hypothetical protein